MYRVWRAEAFKTFHTHLWWGTMALIAIAPLLNFMVMWHLKGLPHQEPLTFTSATTQMLMMLTLLFAPLVVCLLSTLSISTEVQSGTLRYVLTSQIKRWQLMLGKILWVMTWNSLLLLFAFVLNLVLCNMLGMSGIVPWGLEVKTWFTVAASMTAFIPLYVAITLWLSNFFVPICIGIGGTFIGMIVLNSKYVGIYPFTTPIVLLNVVKGNPMTGIIGSFSGLVLLLAAFGCGILLISTALFQRKDVVN